MYVMEPIRPAGISWLPWKPGSSEYPSVISLNSLIVREAEVFQVCQHIILESQRTKKKANPTMEHSQKLC